MQKYHFIYDDFGNTTSIGIGGWNSEEQITLASYEYAAMNGLLTRQTYGNEDYVEFTYDILGRAKTTTYYDENENVDRVLTYVYTGDGQLYSIHDSRTGFLYLYTYDSIGRLIGSSVKNADGEVLMSTRQEYNANNQLVGQHWTVGSTTYSETYTYSTVDGALTSYNNALGETVKLEYDALRRISKMDTTTLDRYYEYTDGKESGQTTGLVSRYWYHTANYDDAYFKYSYSYDALGNISSYTQSGTTYTYTYDDQNQLKTQTGGGKTYTYTYDDAGNILTASNGTSTKSYTYGNALWKDLLTAYNGNYIAYEGQTVSNGVVTGDVIGGNPISYYNGKRYTFTWEEGRNLVSAAEGTNTYTYAYDSNGLRTSKTINGVKHEYLYASGKLLRETYGDVILDFVYDHNGHPFAMRYTTDGTTTNYYYITNLQGDVLNLITGHGVAVAAYSYDPYGRVLTAIGEMANINPLRYRGYYYDVETGFYYLQSRYYDPTICRFINVDTLISTERGVLGYNMFAYCNNNPVCNADVSGQVPSNVVFPECLDGNGPNYTIETYSDEDDHSKELLAIILSTTNPNYICPQYGRVLSISVERDGKYISEDYLEINIGLCVLGIGACYVAPPLGKIAGVTIGGISLINLIGPKSNVLPNKEYKQYSVTIVRESTEYQNGKIVYVEHTFEWKLIYNNTDVDNPSWCCCEQGNYTCRYQS